MELSAVVLPVAGFDVLLGLTWLVKAKVGLDVRGKCLFTEVKNTPLRQFQCMNLQTGLSVPFFMSWSTFVCQPKGEPSLRFSL